MTKPKRTGIIPCPKCDHPTREWKKSAEEYPGTRARRGSGLCTECSQPKRRAPLPQHTATEQARRQRETMQALDEYMRKRRERIARLTRTSA